jgi:hypothetical protein
MTPEQTLQVKTLVDRSDVFNYVISHLRLQGRTSIADGICKYRGDRGTKCAVGALMTDDEYNLWWEDKHIFALIENKMLPDDLHRRLEPHLSMLDDLQQFHDNYLLFNDNGSFEKNSEAHIDELRKKWSIV